MTSLEGDNLLCWYLSSVIKKWPYMRGGLSSRGKLSMLVSQFCNQKVALYEGWPYRGGISLDVRKSGLIEVASL